MREEQLLINGKTYLICDNGTLKNNKGKILKPYKDKVGYYSILVGRKRVLIHRLVAQAFIHDFSEEMQVHHIDENKSNNCVENLKCMSKEEHQKLHKQIYPVTKICTICGKEFTPHETKRKRAKTCSYDCWLKTIKMTTDSQKVKISQYDINGNLIRIWESISDIQRELGYFSSNICKCCKGKINSYKGYVWKYAE